MNTDPQPPGYPQYFRKAGKCVKVISPTETRTIILPPDVRAAERFSTAYPSADRLQASLEGLQLTTEAEFKSFLFTFYQSVRDEHNAISI